MTLAHLANDSRPLPGESYVSERLLDDAVAELNRIYTIKGLEAARAVGQYILQHFFSSDWDAYRDRRNEHLTFRELARHEGIRFSSSYIWYSVAILEQLELLPREIGYRLPYSHHRLLLPVQDADLRLRLAKEAVHQGLSKRELERRVRALRSSEAGVSKAGRRPLPDWVKAGRQATKALESVEVEELDLMELPPDQARDELVRLRRALSRMEALVEAVEEALVVEGSSMVEGDDDECSLDDDEPTLRPQSSAMADRIRQARAARRSLTA